MFCNSCKQDEVNSDVEPIVEPPPQNDPPMITAIVIQPTTPLINEEITVTASAIDQDGDTLDYVWAIVRCSQSLGDSQVVDATNTQALKWKSTTPQVCTLQITVTANAQIASTYIDIKVQDPLAAFEINGVYIPFPLIKNATLVYGVNTCKLQDILASGNCPIAVKKNEAIQISVDVDWGTETFSVDRAVNLTISGDCLPRELMQNQSLGSPKTNTYSFNWIAETAGACLLTFGASNYQLKSTQGVGIKISE